ncbi:uncharacterized protein [Saccopteryx bilineata]|uniref:uncharacterized protein n=1 Tax=Saccopteryx bilineata TaxID=59482 RepID=UPI0033901391
MVQGGGAAARRGAGPGRGAGGPSSRSPRARRRRRRKWRRGRCSRLGQEPCQEKTSSQRSPAMAAAARTGAGPPALLPPRSPCLGPIVWLRRPGGERTGRRREREGEAGRERETEGSDGRREGGREPCAKLCRRVKLWQLKHLLRVLLARGGGLQDSGVAGTAERKASVRGGGGGLGASRVRAESRLNPRSQNKQLKMAATPLRHPPLGGTAPRTLRLRPPRGLPSRRKQRAGGRTAWARVTPKELMACPFGGLSVPVSSTHKLGIHVQCPGFKQRAAGAGSLGPHVALSPPRHVRGQLSGPHALSKVRDNLATLLTTTSGRTHPSCRVDFFFFTSSERDFC